MRSTLQILRGQVSLASALTRRSAQGVARASPRALASSGAQYHTSILLARTALPALRTNSYSLESCSTFSTSATSRQAAVTDDDAVLKDDSGKARPPPVTDRYESMKPHLDYDIWKALIDKPFNFTTMSEVQQRVFALMPALADPFMGEMPDGQGGRDLLVKARTGTGKTVAFLVPAIERRLRAIKNAERGRFTEPWTRMLAKQRPDLNFEELDKNGRERLRRQFCFNTAGVLVLSPTRELATQIAKEAEKLCTHKHDLNVQLLVGGASRREQLRSWNRGRPDIVVATPGRLMDLLSEEELVREPMSALQTLIYDEADTLLDMGFREDMERIAKFLPKQNERMSMLFSATVSKDIQQLSSRLMGEDRRFIDCVPAGEDNVHEHIPQFATVLNSAEEQITHLVRLIALDQIKNAGKSKVVVFAPTTKLVQLLADRFIRGDLKTLLPAGRESIMYELHSKKEAERRFRTSNNFREDASGASVLFTSDVSARGVDYPGTTRVIQVGAPSSGDQYIHRIGRTGRAGAGGRADIILLPFEGGFVQKSLRGLKVKNVTVEETKEELETLCQQFDQDPVSVVNVDTLKRMERGTRGGSSRGPPSRSSSGGRGIASFKGPLSGRLASPALEQKVAEVTMSSDKEEVEQCMLSMLGFYVPTSERQFGCSTANAVDGLKSWAMALADLDRPPYVGENLLRKIGVKGGSSGGRGGAPRGNRFQSQERSMAFGRGGASGQFREGGRSAFESNRGERGSFGSSRGGRGGFGGGGGGRGAGFSNRDSEAGGYSGGGERRGGYGGERRGGFGGGRDSDSGGGFRDRRSGGDRQSEDRF